MRTSAKNSDALLGQVLGDNYRATRYIGRGAMGTIYEATQLRLNKKVAIKVVARDLANNPTAIARFRREAEVTSQLGHPHIVNVFDFGTTPSGEPYMVMEYLEGEDLESRIRRVGTLPLPAVSLLVRQVASALAATHARGIVHRDLKPANLFLVRMEGEPEFTKVVDFGISKVQAEATRITRGHVALGTPQFMAPEQAAARGDEIDHRADQWALACIAFEALAGRCPFVADEPVALVYQVLHEEAPNLTKFAPEMPAALDPVFKRALSKQPTDRYESITAFARAFESATGVDPERMRLSPAEVAAGIAANLGPEDRTIFDDRPPPISRESRVVKARPRLGSRQVLLLSAAGVLALVLPLIWLMFGRSPARPAAPAARPPIAGPQIAPPTPGPGSPAARPPSDRRQAGDTPRTSTPPRPAAGKPRPAPGKPARPRAPRGRLIEEL
jgi:eukaryotic-like serine/threonine-protein kinase